MRRPDNEPLLFDLPLDRPARDDESEPVLERQPQRPPRHPRTGRPPQGGDRAPAAGGPPPLAPPPAADELPLQRSHDRLDPRGAQVPAAGARRPAPQAENPGLPFPAAIATAGGGSGHADAAPAGGSGRVGVGRRLAAGAADLLVHVAVAILALAGCRYLGVVLALRDWPAMAVFLLSFSFLYTVVPLAFWGHTLGMTWAGLTSESAEGEPLSFDQTARRWLGALLTLATLGLALLLALTGRSLADRISGSRTLPA